MISIFKFAVGAVTRVRAVMEAAVGEWFAEALVEQEEESARRPAASAR
jgi:hypothetical protein